MVLTLGGTHPPGARLEFQIGLLGGKAEIKRRFSWSLWAGRQVLEKDEASVEVIGSARPLRLGVQLPPHAPASYELRLKVTDSAGDATSFIWPVEVPEQRAQARLAVRPNRLRRGEPFTATLHNDGPTEIMTGVDFTLERLVEGAWQDVDPFDGDEDVAWPAIGLLVAPGGSRELRVQVPRTTDPGPHRMIKTVSAETAKVRDLRVTAEFTVIPDAEYPHGDSNSDYGRERPAC